MNIICAELVNVTNACVWIRTQTANSRTITLDITLSLRTAEAATTQHVSIITMHQAVHAMQSLSTLTLISFEVQLGAVVADHGA